MRIDVEPISLERMKAEEWFQFFTDFKEMAGNLLSEVEYFAQFLILYAQADDVLELIRKSNFTEQIAEADRQRDFAFRSLREMVKAMTTHVEEDKRKSACNLMLVFDSYGNLTKRGYNEKTASITNFLQELEENYADDVAKLGLLEWLKRLQNANVEFNTLVMKRNDEQSAKLNLRMADIRKQVDALYEELADIIEANARLAKWEAWITFYNKLNANIARYKLSIAQRKGFAKKKKEKQSEQTKKADEQKPE